MADAPIASLEELLRALAKERSLRGRLRVLGHSWTLLRSLSRPEREQVALRLGSKWAWKRVEKAFLQDGELSENEQLVGRAFERMAESDPGELRKLARSIREGDGAAAQDLLLMTLTEALEEEAEEEEAENAEEPELATVSELIDHAEDVLASTLARTVETPEPAPRPAPKVAPVVPRAAPKPEPVAPRAFPTARGPESEPTPEPRRAEPPPALHEPTAPSLGLPIEPAERGNGADRLRVLRALQGSERPGADLGREGRAALLESLGGGWASRRALTRMIRTRSLDGLDEALALIHQLVRPGQQAWCLADLVAYWPLDSAQREQILEAAPTDAARRRLTHRVAASARAS